MKNRLPANSPIQVGWICPGLVVGECAKRLEESLFLVSQGKGIQNECCINTPRSLPRHPSGAGSAITLRAVGGDVQPRCDPPRRLFPAFVGLGLVRFGLGKGRT